MKPVNFARILLAVPFFLTFSNPPPTPVETISSFGELLNEADLDNSSCVMDMNFQPIHHTGRRYLQHILKRLAPGAGIDPSLYAIELMRDVRGYSYINAMTCSASRLIWVSDKAFMELNDNETALAYLLAHELAHSGYLYVDLMHDSNISMEERDLLGSMSYRQQLEIAADRRAVDIMVRAGFDARDIVSAAAFILERDGAELLQTASYSHPAGWDRVYLLGYYVERVYG